MTTATPAFLRRSDAGLYVTRVSQFLASSYADPVGPSEEHRGWTLGQDGITRMFGGAPDLGAIFLFNKQRETQRICPACRRVYHVGEAIAGTNLQANSTERQEQELSGICSYPCAVVMGAAEVMGKSADELHQQDYDRIMERNPLPNGLKFFRIPHGEEKKFGGLQVIFGTKEDYEKLREEFAR
ncbi:hypothetical protein NEOLEDRAFT_935965 [Neolentinus lepideus HHB14362 ss-1]|uniref:Uncharacterized protein n=1 Tax=Neolentinus lepideus HHB14362 ss-1 TaxID=1314782 RepID=A0A165NIR1_9AGAM|nr:hypothetical protein NEOLEDRAFT_935965 [Neolentinus lepideus HHB14362 ss-1]